MYKIVGLLLLVSAVLGTLNEDMDAWLDQLKSSNGLKGIQLEIGKGKEIIYHYNKGEKNDKNEPIDNQTVVRIASLSKSFASVAFMQLVEQGKISLQTTISQGLGFEVKNPFYPNIPITFEMLLSHQSSIVDCDPGYINFLYLTRSVQRGGQIPNIRELLHKDGQYYDECIFNDEEPGTHYEYSNFCFGIVGTVIERITGQRFDEYTRDHILQYLITNQTEIPTFAPWTLANHNNLASLYRGEDGKWVAQADYYPSGKIPQFDMTGYQVGTNGLVFSPQAGLRASVTHLNNYMYMFANKGVTKENVRILSEKSVFEMLKPIYQYHGQIGGETRMFRNYGLGLYKTSVFAQDRVIEHEVVHGHTGEDCGLISAYYFWKDFTFSFYFTGSMEGYSDDEATIYEKERSALYAIVNKYYQQYIKEAPIKVDIIA